MTQTGSALFPLLLIFFNAVQTVKKHPAGTLSFGVMAWFR